MIRTLTLTTVLLLPSYGFLENKAAIPVTHEFGHLGAEITLRCNTSYPYVEWRFNGRKVEDSDDVYSNGSRHLTLVETKGHQSGKYTCHHPHSGETLALMELQLGLPPEKLHIQCWSSSYPEKINCTWDLEPRSAVLTTFLTTYRLGLMGPKPPQQCTQHELNPNSCVISNFRMFEEFPYLLNVTAVNPLGSITQLYSFFADNIIRPDPPVNVNIHSICWESRKLYVRWRPPHSWPYPEIFSLKYKIRYRKKGSKSYTTVGPYEQTSLVLTGIRPGSTIYVQVAAHDITDLGHSSDWSDVVVGHPWHPYDIQCFHRQLNNDYVLGFTASKNDIA